MIVKVNLMALSIITNPNNYSYMKAAYVNISKQLVIDEPKGA